MTEWMIAGIIGVIGIILTILIIKLIVYFQLKNLKGGYNGTEDKSRRIGKPEAADDDNPGDEEPGERELLPTSDLAEFGLVETRDSEDEPTRKED